MSLRKFKGALGRPLALERRDGHLRVVLVERRRAAGAEAQPLEARISAALRAHLARTAGSKGSNNEQLDVVSAKFDDGSWPGIASLPAKLLGKAIVQAEALAREQSSDLLALFVDRLRQIKTVVETREDRRPARRQAHDSASVIVTEVSHEEFEALQRSWSGTVPGGLGPPIGDSPDDAR